MSEVDGDKTEPGSPGLTDLSSSGSPDTEPGSEVAAASYESGPAENPPTSGTQTEESDTAKMMDTTQRLPLDNTGAPISPPLADIDFGPGPVNSNLEGAYGPSGVYTAGGPPTGPPGTISALDPIAGSELIRAPTSEPVSAGARPEGTVLPPSLPNTGWSTMGETPNSPPAQRGLPQGAPKYLPPVDPPGAVLTPKTATVEKRKGGWGWRALTSFVAGGLIAAAGFGAAQYSSTAADEAAGGNLAAESSSGVTTAAAQQLPPVDVDEPAAYVANLLGPAVVQVETDFGLGSGVIFDDGLVLTNHHVVDGARSIRIRLSDGRSLLATLEGSDPNTDIAVIAVEKGLDLPIASLATGEEATVGQIAIAIGSPFQLQQTVTAGIVSAVGRPIPIGNQRVVAMIQTDAPINPGNSGGALADKQGRVIGINTSIQTDGTSSTNAGVGFAVPIDTARRIADLLVSGAPIESGFLGVEGRVPLGGEAGVEIDKVTPGSAAELAGLKQGDRVLSLDGAPVTRLDELAGLVLARQAGDQVELEVVRDAETVAIQVTLGVRDG